MNRREKNLCHGALPACIVARHGLCGGSLRRENRGRAVRRDDEFEARRRRPFRDPRGAEHPFRRPSIEPDLPGLWPAVPACSRIPVSRRHIPSGQRSSRTAPFRLRTSHEKSILARWRRSIVWCTTRCVAAHRDKLRCTSDQGSHRPPGRCSRYGAWTGSPRRSRQGWCHLPYAARCARSGFEGAQSSPLIRVVGILE